jgi:hypothetical protein
VLETALPAVLALLDAYAPAADPTARP